MKVIVTKPCFVNARLWAIGEELEIEPKQFSDKCMEKVNKGGRPPKAKEEKEEKAEKAEKPEPVTKSGGDD
jgi:hypothetical protein